ncbi:MAG: hypothetical protein E7667_02480 [Ruminococcaceae bacterium]|nr:hypothetical protein [Oscillospiraceae bacterium]
MSALKTDTGIRALYKNLRYAKNDSGVYTFFEPASLPVHALAIEKFVNNCKKNKIKCIIPCLSRISEVSGGTFALISDMYELLLTNCQKANIRVGFCIDKLLEDCFFCDTSPVPKNIRDTLCTKILNHREYYCVEGEDVHMDLSEHSLMSITLFNGENAEYFDISSHVVNGILDYTPPMGNWTVNAYTCDIENILDKSERITLNKLNYNHVQTYISTVLDIMGDKVKRHIGKTLSLIYMNDICFDAPNRRNWDCSFNDKFKEMFGFSPEPYYNALFYSIGEKTPHFKTLFMTCRAKMLFDGVFSALADFADKHGLELINGITEPKLADCSWLTGDALENFSYSPCAMLDKAYMYGINSLNLATAAQQNYGLSDVYCELFKDYFKISYDIAYKDTLNAYSRGCTRLLSHIPYFSSVSHKENNKQRKKLFSLSARCRYLLNGGTQVSDIAILYPSYSMHSEIYLYQTKSEGFEYPDILPYNDHMTVINMLSTFCGHNSTLIHPETMKNSCSVKGKKIRMTTPAGTNDFSVLILPGVSVIDPENLELIREFYDNGGKIIATGRLPHYSAQYHPEHEKPANENDFMHLDEYASELDGEVRDTVAYIFGSETSIKSKLKEYYSNCNSKGGEAYFLCASKTTSDGTLFCNEYLLKSILYSLEVPFDAYMCNLPEQMGYDALNDTYPNFSRLGLHATIPGGGTVNHIHKKHPDGDIYFFTNSTDAPYNGYIFLKGRIPTFSIDPESGKKRTLLHRHVKYLGNTYTAVHLNLAPSSSMFILSPAEEIKDNKKFPEIISMEHNFLTE